MVKIHLLYINCMAIIQDNRGNNKQMIVEQFIMLEGRSIMDVSTKNDLQ